MSAFHAVAFLFPGECVTTTRKPASCILVLIDSPRPPMPPVISAILFGTIVTITPPVWMRSNTAGRYFTERIWRYIDPHHKLTRSGHVQAAIDGNVGAGDVAGVVGGKIGHQTRDFVRLRQPPHRDRGHDLLAHLG